MASTTPLRRPRPRGGAPVARTSRRGQRHRHERRLPWSVLALLATVGGLILTLRYHPAASGETGAPGQLVAAGAAETSQLDGANPAGRANPTGRANQPAAVGTPKGAVLGRVVDTDFGPMQVQITVTKGKLTSSKAVRLTSAGRTSVRINQRSLPILYTEALHAQSARIDSVSGATVTSDGYKKSLQTALDLAHLG